MDNFQGPDLEVTNSSSFSDLLRTGWGPELGTILALRFPNAPIYDGWINVLPSVKEDRLELLIGLETKTLCRLREDDEWTALAQEFL